CDQGRRAHLGRLAAFRRHPRVRRTRHPRLPARLERAADPPRAREPAPKPPRRARTAPAAGEAPPGDGPRPSRRGLEPHRALPGAWRDGRTHDARVPAGLGTPLRERSVSGRAQRAAGVRLGDRGARPRPGSPGPDALRDAHGPDALEPGPRGHREREKGSRTGPELSAGALEPAAHLPARDGARLLVNDAAAFQDGEVRNALDAEFVGEPRIPLGVDLQDEGPTRHVRRGARDLGRRDLAGAAPVGPEIDEDRNLGLARDLAKGLLVHLERLRDGRDLRRAGAAAARVGQPPGRRPVLLSAGGAAQDHRRISSIEAARRCSVIRVGEYRATTPRRSTNTNVGVAETPYRSIASSLIGTAT